VLGVLARTQEETRQATFLKTSKLKMYSRSYLLAIAGVMAAIFAVGGGAATTTHASDAMHIESDCAAAAAVLPEGVVDVIGGGGQLPTVVTDASAALRNYDAEKDKEASRVRNHYADMRKHQTEEYIRAMEKEFGELNKANMTLRQAFKLLEDYVDASDPDMELPNIVHAFMAAEAARRIGQPDWMQLTALLHDLGKMMFAFGKEENGMSGRAAGPQWALGGDTWVLGSPIPHSAVFPEFNKLNADHKKLVDAGIDLNQNGTGIRNLRFAWGHDEYAYRVLSHTKNGCKLPEEALQIVRLHSCYPLHSKRAYDRLLAPGDDRILQAVIDFNKFDLYSKADNKNFDMESLWPYYEGLMDKYFERGRNGLLHF
jgi:inositol oxygenase